MYSVPWEPKVCSLCRAWFQKPMGLQKHHRTTHSDVRLKWVGEMCWKDGVHAAVCHYAKCRGEDQTPKPFVCEVCGTGFTSQSGLSQHKRHPERRQEEREQPNRRMGVAGGGVWTVDEVQVIINYFSAADREGSYTSALLPFLPGKSRKQIRDKVALLRQGGGGDTG